MSIRDRIKKFEALNQDGRAKSKDDSAAAQPGAILYHLVI